MKALILVAGQSVRMGAMTENTHKTLLPIRNRPILDWMLSALQKNGINRVLFTSGYHQEMLKSWVAEAHPEISTSWTENPDYASTNTAYSVWMAREEILSDDDDLLLINGDVVLDHRVIGATLAAPGINVLATRFDRVAEEEVKVTLKDGLVTEIGKHLKPSEAAGESIGINRLSHELLTGLIPTIEQRINEGNGRKEFYEQAFDEMIQKGAEFRTADVTHLPVIEIDTPEDYEEAQQTHASSLEE